MSQTYIKPPDPIVQPALKIFKKDFDRPDIAADIPNLMRAAFFPNNPATKAWSGEILNRVAEWHARHGDVGKAHELFELSLERFHPAETLGPARDYRDFARLYVTRGRYDDAFSMLQAAIALHERDRHNQKGQRQRRVTQACLLETRVVADDDRSSAVEELVDLALYEIGDFCLRDQHDRVAFVLPYTRGAAKRALHVRQLEINMARRRPVGTVTSIAQVVIDKELHVTGRIAGAIFSKGVARLPRPQ